jgi:hypothetical protein
VFDVIDLYEKVSPKIGNGVNERAAFVGCLLRQAGHDFMDFRDWKIKGGSDGCINFKEDDNKGIQECVQKFDVDRLYQKWNKKVSLADFLVIIAEAAIGRVETESYNFFKDKKFDRSSYFRDLDDGTPVFAKYLRDTFKFGRKTADKCNWNKGRMPKAENSCDGKAEPGKKTTDT